MARYNKKFSKRYCLEKWLYEDSKDDIKKMIKFVLEGLALVAMLASLFLIPALFH